MNAIEKVKQCVKSHTLTENVFAYFLTKTGYADKYLAGLVSMFKTAGTVKKKYAKYIGTLSYDIPNGDDMDVIWFCWMQGFDNMTEISKICYDSICKYSNGKKVIFIDENNFSDYASLPDYIVDKWKKGIISYAHFSDILRIELLLEHGGIWIDSTVLLTDTLPSYITQNEFFVYRNGWMDQDMINMSSWLMKSQKGNNLILQTRNILFKYWEKENYLKNYFLLHIFFRFVTDKYIDQWNNVPNYPQNDEHILQFELNTKYNKKRIDEIKARTSVHKLSNKLNFKNISDDSVLAHLEKTHKI